LNNQFRRLPQSIDQRRIISFSSIAGLGPPRISVHS
jgi:hypothetical protein